MPTVQDLMNQIEQWRQKTLRELAARDLAEGLFQMRMMTVFINKKPVSFQVSEHAAVRFSHLAWRDVNDGTQIEIQNWDKRNTLQRKNRSFTSKNLFK